MPLAPRLTALVIFAIALLSLRGQFDASHALRPGGSVPATLWALAGYFTILTNLLVAGLTGLVALRWRVAAGAAFAVTLSIVMVAAVYHLLLAGLVNPVGLAWWADQGLHTAVPLLMLAWWLAFAPVPEWRALAPALIWPFCYLLYAVARGGATGSWPYPFLDVAQRGWGGVAVSIAGVALGFGAMGVLLIAVKRRSA